MAEQPQEAEEHGVCEGEGAGGSAVAANDPIRPASVRGVGGVGRGDGGILRRVRAAQEAAPERGEVLLVCEKHWGQRLSVTIIRGRVTWWWRRRRRRRGRRVGVAKARPPNRTPRTP